MSAKVHRGCSLGGSLLSIGEGEHRRQVTIEQRFYNNLDHGYATTIHKSQGATVDRVKVLASLSLDRHLTYVAMTRHREDLAIYYGRRSFAKSGGLIPILSRRNAKETTLDYEKSSFYGQALALRRGARPAPHERRPHDRPRSPPMGRPAETEARRSRRPPGGNRRDTRAAPPAPKHHPNPERPRRPKPMVSGISTFPKSIDQSVEDKLAADPGLKKQWEDVSTRFHLVYAQPESAFKAVNVDAMLKDQAIAKTTLAKIAGEPERFGALRGKTGRVRQPGRQAGPRTGDRQRAGAGPQSRTLSSPAGRGRTQA